MVEQRGDPGPLEADARSLDVVLVVGRIGLLGPDDPGQLGRQIGHQLRRLAACDPQLVVYERASRTKPHIASLATREIPSGKATNPCTASG